MSRRSGGGRSSGGRSGGGRSGGGRSGGGRSGGGRSSKGGGFSGRRAGGSSRSGGGFNSRSGRSARPSRTPRFARPSRTTGSNPTYVAVPSTGYRRRWYGGNRHHYDDGHGYAPRPRGGGIASAIGCLAFAVVVPAVVIAIAVL